MPTGSAMATATAREMPHNHRCSTSRCGMPLLPCQCAPSRNQACVAEKEIEAGITAASGRPRRHGCLRTPTANGCSGSRAPSQLPPDRPGRDCLLETDEDEVGGQRQPDGEDRAEELLGAEVTLEAVIEQ